MQVFCVLSVGSVLALTILDRMAAPRQHLSNEKLYNHRHLLAYLVSYLNACQHTETYSQQSMRYLRSHVVVDVLLCSHIQFHHCNHRRCTDQGLEPPRRWVLTALLSTPLLLIIRVRCA